MRRKTVKALAVASVMALTMTACGSSGSSSSSAGAGASGLSNAKAVKSIAFFGFWKSNSFTQAVYQGVQTAASKAGVQVVDLTTPDYDAAAQLKAVQDQTVKGLFGIKRGRVAVGRGGFLLRRAGF